MASWKRVITTSDDSSYKNSNIQAATTSANGGIKLFSDTAQSEGANSVSTTANRTYGIQLDGNGKAVVNVPWNTGTDTVREVSVTQGENTNTLESSETLELKAGTNITLSETLGVVTITASDSNTEYSAGTGMALSGTTFSIGQSVGVQDSVEFGRVDVDSLRIDDNKVYVNGTTGNLDIQAGSSMGDVRVLSNLYCTGNLTVTGSTTTISTETIKLADNTIVLNSNQTGTPAEDGGIEVERGDRANVNLIWDESALEWTSQVYKSSSNDTTEYNGKVPVIERASTGTSGADTTVGSMFINTNTGNFYIYS